MRAFRIPAPEKSKRKRPEGGAGPKGLRRTPHHRYNCPSRTVYFVRSVEEAHQNSQSAGRVEGRRVTDERQAFGVLWLRVTNGERHTAQEKVGRPTTTRRNTGGARATPESRQLRTNHDFRHRRAHPRRGTNDQRAQPDTRQGAERARNAAQARQSTRKTTRAVNHRNDVEQDER